jgi:hypothetical protein
MFRRFRLRADVEVGEVVAAVKEVGEAAAVTEVRG